ncbi:hypothetical protein M9H77_24795 [Catharanthus roseus]|uniref:Uncharacterized protein n=1 Tax=Catharanthus roseus TaxID=4058 RepID=A0ACC0A6B6_CATRO|nr:hypothetical protein M9H77_24795 [Catharanthus roseus]
MGSISEPLLDDDNNNNLEFHGRKKPVGFIKDFGIESKKLWKIAGPAILTSIFQYLLGLVTQIFAGHIGEIDLAAFTIGNLVVDGLAFGVMLGMGSALETLCGQAFGSGRIRMLGIYMQRSWVIVITTATILLPIYIFAPTILHLFGLTPQMSKAAGKFAQWMIPQLYAYALNFPIQKFLQAQGKLGVMTWVSGLVLLLHIFISWLFVSKLHCGLVGAALTLDVSWWLVVIGQLFYIFITKSDGAWNGFSSLAFQDLFSFLKLSIASAVMMWYPIVIVGRLANPLVSVDAVSICVRVSNELGAGNAEIAKFSVIVVTLTSFLIGALFMALLMATKYYFPLIYSTSEVVDKETTRLAYFLAFTALIDSVQIVLSGVAVGAGWQVLVGCITLCCYYVIGLPVAILLGFVAHLGVMGIWSGMLEPLVGSEDGGEKPVGFINEFGIESKKLWGIAAPAIFTYIFQFLLGLVSQIFAGHIGELDLAAFATGNLVVGGLAFGVMAFGAGQIRMLGIYMQRSWVILLATATILLPFYIFTAPILHFLGETTQISKATGRFAVWIIPQLYAYALNFPIQKFLQAQSKLAVMTWVSGVVLVLHIFFNWFFIFKLGWGLIGAALTLDISWWLLVIGQLLYILIAKSDGAWSGFSWLAFQDLFGFVKLSLASAVMFCLESWYLRIAIVIAGRLRNPLVPVDAYSICLNIEGFIAMIFIGFNAAASVRVSNELGAGSAQKAKFSVIAVTLTSLLTGILFMVVVLATRDYFPHIFTTSEVVAKETSQLAYLLAFTAVLDSVQVVLSGVATGVGWQALIGYINLGCYYIIGLPIAILLGFVAHFGVMGIWGGMISGICLQAIILLVLIALTNWQNEAGKAENRIKQWGGRISDA